jgi:hypothetical protein
MQQFKFFNEKTKIAMRKLVKSSGVDLGKMKQSVLAFLKYMDTDFESNMELYKATLDVDNINLDTIINVKYKFLLKGIELKNSVRYLKSLTARVKDFKGKESNLKVLLGIQILYYMLVVKLVEIYLGALSTYAANKQDTSNIKLKDIGIDNKILKFFAELEDLKLKTIDEWIALDISDIEENYYLSAFRRIFIILGKS